MSWRQWLGIPWRDGGRDRAGVDCWGLVALVYRERYGIELPEVGPYELADTATAAPLIAHGRAAWIDARLSPREGDVVLLVLGGAPTHVGVLVDERRMLHVLRGQASRIDVLDRPPWWQRIDGIYRWPGRA